MSAAARSTCCASALASVPSQVVAGTALGKELKAVHGADLAPYNGKENPLFESIREACVRDASGKLVGRPGKFEGLRPFSIWLYEKSLDGSFVDQDFSGPDGWHGRIGRHVIEEDSQGFVSHIKFDNLTLAMEYMDRLEDEYADDDDDNNKFEEV